MEPINDSENKEIFGFILQPVGKGDFGSTIYYGYKAKETNHFKKNPKLHGIKIGDDVVIESIARFDDDSKDNKTENNKKEDKFDLIKERIKAISTLCDDNEEFANFLGMKKTSKLIYAFYEFNKKSCLKRLNKKDSEYVPCREDEIQAVKTLNELTKIYQKLKDKFIIHRMIYPEFMFYEGTRLKLLLFGICIPEKYFAKSTMKNSKNKPPECITNTSGSGKRNKIYTYKFDIWNMGLLLWYLIYGYNYFNEHDSNKRKEEIKNFDIDQRNELSDDIKVLLKGCLNQDENTRMSLDELKNHLQISLGKIPSNNMNVYMRVVDESQSGIDSNQNTLAPDDNESKAKSRLIAYESKEKLDQDIKTTEKAFKSLLNQLEISYEMIFSFEGNIQKQVARALLYQGKALSTLYEQCFTYYPKKIINVSGKDSNIKKNFIIYLGEIKLEVNEQVNLIKEIVNGLGINENSTKQDLNFFIQKLKDLLSDIFILGEKNFNNTPFNVFIENANEFIKELERPCFNCLKGSFDLD